MDKNPYAGMQAEQDFEKAKRKGWLQTLHSIIAPESKELLSFHEIRSLIRPKKENYLGMRVVPLSAILGSEDRYQDFSRHFFPKKEHLRNRWTSIDQAFITDVILPPIKLYKIGEIYFVRDGNHRVSVARTQKALSIDAEVVELTSEISVVSSSRREDIIQGVLEHERQRVLEQTGLDKIIPMEYIDFTTPGRYDEMLNHILGHKYFMNLDKHEEMSFEEAACSWYEVLFLPILKVIQKEKIIQRFPGRTDGDMYVWIIKHWHSLKGKYGEEYPLDMAISEYAASHGKNFWMRLRASLKRFFKGGGN